MSGESNRNHVTGMEEQSGVLQEHQRLKLELASIIRSVMELFRQAHDVREEQARRLLARLAEDQFNLAVVGQFKRGKSSLMNAVIGMDRLPTGILPLTSVVTTVRYSDHESVLIRTSGSSFTREISLDELEEYVTEKGNPGNRKQARLAEVRLPSEILRLGFHFIDTPGVGSSIAENTETTHRFLPEADAVVFVTSFESTMNESEQAFLRAVARHVHKIFFVVNKRDLVSEEESRSVIESMRKTISVQLGISDPRIFAVSARLGLEAKLSGDTAVLEQSGLPVFESALTRFLTSERAAVSLFRYVERTIVLLSAEVLESRANQVCAGLDSEAALRMKRRWEMKMGQIRKKCSDTVKSLQDRLASQMPARFDPALSAHCGQLRDNLAAQISSLLTQHVDFITSQDLRNLANGADSVAEEQRHQWLSRHRKEFMEAAWGAVAEGIKELERLYSEALEFATGLFRLPQFSAGRWSIGDGETDFLWKFGTRFEWLPRLSWQANILPMSWVRRRVQREYETSLRAATVAYCERMRQALAEVAGEWALRVSAEVQHALNNLDAQVSAVIEGRGPSEQAGKATVLLDRLETLRESLRSKSPDGPAPQPFIPRRGRGIRRCFVCEHVESELFEFFSTWQYEITVNEDEQRAHAGRSGFCPLHTWQYQQIASPEGVSIAYAPVLEAVARRLRSIAVSESSPQAMQERIRDFYPSNESCPACRRMMEAEEAAIAQFRQTYDRSSNEEADVGLCVRHLGAALTSETDLEMARNLVLEEAAALDRISEDLQTYSLKRDALRRELATDEESIAYLSALSLLSGRRRLLGG